MAAARRLRLRRPIETLLDVSVFLKINFRHSDLNIATKSMKQFQAMFKMQRQMNYIYNERQQLSGFG